MKIVPLSQTEMPEVPLSLSEDLLPLMEVSMTMVSLPVPLPMPCSLTEEPLPLREVPM